MACRPTNNENGLVHPGHSVSETVYHPLVVWVVGLLGYCSYCTTGTCGRHNNQYNICYFEVST